MRRVELLSPAGSPEAVRAAIAAGADAVYLGAGSHGARAGAGFDDESLKAAIRLAHLYGRRVYVTVNTLTKQNELKKVRALLDKLVLFKADAAIVQDVGILRLIKAAYPSLSVHASTQMSVHNAHGASLLKDLGADRVILARECGLDDIRAVVSSGVETEVFVHGAMCVSVSGQCLFSSHIGGRSGNRGRCAQPCRLQYRYGKQSGALLSMYDLNTLENLPALCAAGVMSLKVEGRLKRPEYVSVVIGIYRQALDKVLSGIPLGDLKREQAELDQIFSRGFTPGHAFSAEDSALINVDSVAHRGLKIGSVKSFRQRDGFVLAEVRLDLPLSNGDGLAVRGKLEQECIYSGPDVPTGQAATLRLRQVPEIGDTVFKLQDERQLSAARQAAACLPDIRFNARLRLKPGEPSNLRATSGKASFTSEGDAPQAAMNQALTPETAERQLAKTGGTPFVLNQLDFHGDAPSFLPSAAINALRRSALEGLKEEIIAAHTVPEPSPGKRAVPLKKHENFASNLLYAVLPPDFSAKDFKAFGVDRVIRYPDNYRKGRLENQLFTLDANDIILLPRQISDNDLKRVLNICNDSGLQVMADNIGQLGGGQSNVSLSGEGIPVWNNIGLSVLASLGVKSIVLSRELSKDEIQELSKEILELILPVYGHTQLMQLNHCPERLSRGLSGNKAGCLFCERGQGIRNRHLIDRMDAAYPLTPTHFSDKCLIALHAPQPLHLSAAAQNMSWLIDLRLENDERAMQIARHYAALMRGELTEDFGKPELGRYALGVE